MSQIKKGKKNSYLDKMTNRPYNISKQKTKKKKNN